MSAHLKPWALRSLAGASLLLLFLALGEGLARAAVVLLHREPVLWSDTLTGWSGRPGLVRMPKKYLGGEYRLSTDALGQRVVREKDVPASAGETELILLGDSFVAGMGVEDEETLGWILSYETSYRVINLGVIGFGTDQELLSLERFLRAEPGLRGGEIVLLLFGNDFEDVQRPYYAGFARSKPRFTMKGEALERGDFRLPLAERIMDVSVLLWILRSRASMMLAAPDPPAAGGRDIVAACLREMKRLAEAHASNLHVLGHRRLRGDSPMDARLFGEFLRANGGTDITDLILSLPEANPLGPDQLHWSGAGHRRVAEIISR
ncbi:MAG: hypothetical protein DMF49_05510, partial [Acidobacteria bacterium]